MVLFMLTIMVTAFIVGGASSAAMADSFQSCRAHIQKDNGFEESGAPPARSRGRMMDRQDRPQYTVSGRGRRQLPFSRSPSPVRSGGAVALATLLSAPSRQETSVTAAAQGGGSFDGRKPKACSSFKAGDRVIYSNQYGVEERGMILTVYPNDNRCKFRADDIYHVGKVAGSDLMLNQAYWACSSFKVGDKVVYSNQYGVEEPGVIVTVYDNDDGYEFRIDGWMETVDASDLVLDEVCSACRPWNPDERKVCTGQDEVVGPGMVFTKHPNHGGRKFRADACGSGGTVVACDLVRDGADGVTTTVDCKAMDTAEAIATISPQSTPPLTPATLCSVSSTPTTIAGTSGVKAFFGSVYDQGYANDIEGDEGEDEDDTRERNEVGDPLSLDVDDGAVVETRIKGLSLVTGFGFSSSLEEEEEEEEEEEVDDDDAPAAGYLTAAGPNMEFLEPSGENMDGGFGDIVFVTEKKTGEEYAFKKAKDTNGGRRQMEREVQVLREVRGEVSHIVQVQEIRLEPFAMLLMQREQGTLSSMLKDARNSVPAEIVKVLSDALDAVGELHEKFNYLHRDLKPENILVDKHGNGKLVDFGMCVKARDASRPENIGDGTPAYCAPEASSPGVGATVASEIYAVGAMFIEGLMNNCPFGNEELLKAATDRLVDLEINREILVDKIEEEEDAEEKEENDEDGEEEDDDSPGEKSAEKQLELVRIKEHRLGVASEDGWEPDDAALAVVAEMGPPLGFFVVQTADDNRSKEERGDKARQEAQGNPRKLFEDNWAEWLTTSSKAACDEGLRQAVELVLGRAMLDPNPASRPQTTEAAKEVLREALAAYEAAEGAE